MYVLSNYIYSFGPHTYLQPTIFMTTPTNGGGLSPGSPCHATPLYSTCLLGLCCTNALMEYLFLIYVCTKNFERECVSGVARVQDLGGTLGNFLICVFLLLI